MTLPDPEPDDPNSWPALIAWIGRCRWAEWLKIIIFLLLMITAARVIGWL